MSTQANYIFTSLSFYRLVSVSGSDAANFLQNQLSNDIQQLSDSHSQLSSYSSAKGMMYSNFRVIKHGDSYLLRIPADIAEIVSKRLSMFVLRDDVHIRIEESLNILGLSGSSSLSALETLELDIPQDIDEVTNKNGIVTVKALAATDDTRFELVIPKNQMDDVQKLLQGNEADYLASQIRAGEAVITESTYEQLVAQNLNLELINGVNFKKGCYPGQEYIARTQYRGQVRSRTYLIKYNADKPAGSELFEQNKTDGDSIGKIINCTTNATQNLALAVIRNKQAEKNTVCFADDTIVEILDLPYSFGDDKDK